MITNTSDAKAENKVSSTGMNSQQIYKKFLQYFTNTGHKQIKNSSLVPENDPSVLFTTAGMHPLVPYLMGETHPLGKRLTNIQRCVRTDDIDEVGDTIHLTFFEMLGFWSLGDYFKDTALKSSFDFFTSTDYMGFDPKRLYVTVFAGDESVPRDEESIKIWKDIYNNYGIKAEVYEESDDGSGAENVRIFPLGKKENWWGPVGNTGPCGPDSEIFYWRGESAPNLDEFVPWDTSNMFIEIGNNVFIQYDKQADGTFKLLNQKNVDFGGGFERLALVSQFKQKDGSVPYENSVYDTDLFVGAQNLIKGLINDPNQRHKNTKNKEFYVRAILDHIRATLFLAYDGIYPSNKDQGYILRRLIRRVVRFAKELGIEDTSFLVNLAEVLLPQYVNRYQDLQVKSTEINQVLLDEINKFSKTLNTGSKKFNKLFDEMMQKYCVGWTPGGDLKVVVDLAFNIYQSDGYPFEMAIEDIKNFKLKLHPEFFTELENVFSKKINQHQQISREGADQKFKGGLADSSQNTIKYHTATHLLHFALRKVLGDEVVQHGSNITGDRLRFDFNFDRKLTDAELSEVQKTINNLVSQALPVKFEILEKEEALKTGAIHAFNEKYGDQVKVYYIGESLETAISKEFCGGLHVKNTSEIGQVEIFKQDKIGKGMLRVYARTLK